MEDFFGRRFSRRGRGRQFFLQNVTAMMTRRETKRRTGAERAFQEDTVLVLDCAPRAPKTTTTPRTIRRHRAGDATQYRGDAVDHDDATARRHEAEFVLELADGPRVVHPERRAAPAPGDDGPREGPRRGRLLDLMGRGVPVVRKFTLTYY